MIKVKYALEKKKMFTQEELCKKKYIRSTGRHFSRKKFLLKCIVVFRKTK